MQYLLLAIILVQFGVLLYKDWLNSKLIKDLTLKMKAQNVYEYQDMTETDEEKQKRVMKDNPLVSIEDSPLWEKDEELLEAIKKSSGGKDAKTN